MQFPNFIGGSYVSDSPIADQEQTINFYVEEIEAPGATTRRALYPTPGVDVFATTTRVGGRAAFAFKSRAFCVIGDTFYELNSDGTVTSRGTVAVDSHPATISTNGDGGGELFVTSGNNGYIFDLTANTFTLVRTGATAQGAHIDGYFLALDAATSTVFLSDLLDGTTWDPTQFAQRSIAPDPWVSLKVLDRYVWLLGSQTSEIWYNAGTFPFPFAPHPSGLIPYGCAAAFSPTVVGGTLCWLGATSDGVGQVLRASGFTPDVISTFALQTVFAMFSTLSDAVGDTYQDLGHTFYILTFPTANKTVCYDATSTMSLPPAQRWTDRETWISEASRGDAWRPLFHCYAFGRHLMLDRSGLSVLTLSATSQTDVDSRPIRRVRRTPALVNELQRISYPGFELDLETGITTTTVDPQIALRISRDGGKTWGPERWRSAGKLGTYQTRVQWLRCGSARRAVFELVVSDGVPWRILNAYLLGFKQSRSEAA